MVSPCFLCNCHVFVAQIYALPAGNLQPRCAIPLLFVRNNCPFVARLKTPSGPADRCVGRS